MISNKLYNKLKISLLIVHPIERVASAVPFEGILRLGTQPLEFRSAKVSKKNENKELFALKIVKTTMLPSYMSATLRK